MKIVSTTLLSALAAGAVLFSAASAQDADPDVAIKYRKDAMAAVGAHVRGLVAILKGEMDHQEGLALHANGLAAAANTGLTTYAFRQNTDGQGSEETTATAKIWEDWDRFEKAFSDLEAASLDIQAAAANGELTSFDQLKPALMTCGFCHREAGYRQK